jgi:uncharacterized membrane protein
MVRGNVHKLVLIIILLALLPGNTHAFTADEYSTSITLDHSGNSRVLVNLVFDSTTVKEYMSLPIFEPEYLTVTDSFGDLKTATVDTSALIRPNENEEGYSFDMRYVSSSLTEKKNGIWEISYVLEPFEHLQFDEIGEVYIEMELPSGAQLKTFSGDGEVLAGDDNCINVHWHLKNAKIDEPILFSVEYLISPAPFSAPVEDTQSGSYFNEILLVALFFAFVIGTAYFSKRGKSTGNGGENEITIKDDVLKSLSPIQQQILSTIAESGGQLYQREIQKKTNIAKATLSRNLNQLTERGAVKKEGWGNNNKILLSDWATE